MAHIYAAESVLLAYVVVAKDVVPGEVGYCRCLDRVLVDVYPVRV